MAQTYQVIITPEAQEQVHQIVTFWDENHSYEKATKVLVKISEAIDALANMPSRYAIVPSISKRGTMYRRILAKPYRIVFVIDEGKILVTVVDVDHEKRDPQIIIDKLG